MKPRRLLTATVLGMGGLALAANGTLVGAAPEPPTADAGTHKVTKAVDYSCTSGDPAVSRPVKAGVAVTLPGSVAAGQPVRLRGAALTFSLPHDALPAPATPDTARRITGAVMMELGTISNGKRTTTPLALSIPDTPLAMDGDTALTATGEATPVAKAVPGDLVVDLGAPSITLHVDTAELKMTCTAEAPAVLAIVSVPKAGTKPGTPKPPAGRQSGPGGSGGATTDLLDDPVPPPYFHQSVEPFGLTGWSTVRKVKAKLGIGPAVILDGVLHIPLSGDPKDQTLQDGNVALPPTKGNFLGFDFVPTSADVELLPVDHDRGDRTIKVGLVLLNGPAVSHMETIVRIYNVKVNGVPLDVGPNCRTATPTKIDLVSDAWDASQGGLLHTDPKAAEEKYRGFTLPPFTGCGVTEQLSPLVTGLNSGQGNQICVVARAVSVPLDPNAPKC